MDKQKLTIKIICFLLIIFFFVACKKSKDAELLFRRIGSFEVLGMKFGVDNDRFKDVDEKDNKINSILMPNIPSSVIDVEKSLVRVSKEISSKVVNIKAEFSTNKSVSIKEKGFPEGEKGKIVYSSGFFISWDGYIATSARTIYGAKKITVTLNDKRNFSADIKGIDRLTDIAVLKIDPDKALDPVKLGDSSKLRVGQMIVSMGNPTGVNNTVISGIISFVPEKALSLFSQEDYLQISIPIYSGSLGGPMLNLDGFVVGMNTFSGDDTSGVGLVIPSHLLKNVVDQIIRYGDVKRSWLGAEFQDLSEEMAENFNYPLLANDGSGVLINDIFTNSPADNAGLLIGDILISINRQNVFSQKEVEKKISLIPFGSNADIAYFRSGKKRSQEIVLDKIKTKSESALHKINNGPDWTGIVTGEKPIVSKDGKNVENILYVHSVANLSPAHVSGIKTDDIILEINGRPIRAFKDYKNEIDSEETLRMLVIKARGEIGQKHYFLLTKK